MPRVLLLVPTVTYRAPDFVAAARALGVDLVVGTDDAAGLAADGRLVTIPLADPDAATDTIEAIDRKIGVDAVVAVDDGGSLAAARAGERLGFPHNPPDAVAATRDKAEMRRRLARAEVPQPRFASTGADVGYPCVVKPTGLSGSRGVIRCDTPEAEHAARARIAAFWSGPVIVEQYVPGVEVAVEGLLRAGDLELLATFDKPDPLVGPYFEETLYVTPSRLPVEQLRAVERATARAASALGLTEGPVHAELRIDGERLHVIEVAARSIGGLCARTLRFGVGVSLEELVLRHACSMPLDGIAREQVAAGVMMLPIPRSGTLAAVHGREHALAVPLVEGLELTIPVGRPVVALPEGDRYLGFLFARGPTSEVVETALREATSRLGIVVK